MSNILEALIELPAEHEKNVFGTFDEHLKTIEKTLNVTLVSRDGLLKILGAPERVEKARRLLEQLLELSRRGTAITAQSVNYALSLAMEEKEKYITQMDQDLICHTIQGRPIRPKTLGQKQYVELIRKDMIVFGIGPAGTGKT